MEVKFTAPEVALINHIADNMRDEDVEEIWHASRVKPLDALMRGWGSSSHVTIATVDDEPVVMFGVVSRDVLSGAGIVWLLGTHAVLKYQRSFMKYSYTVIKEMLQHYSVLYNYVYSGNTVSMRWLKRVGFKIDQGQPFGPDREIFHKFHIERSV